MGLQVGELFATLGLNDSGFQKGLSSAQASLSKTANKMAMMGGALSLGLTMPLVKLGKEVFGAATALESAFTGVRKTIDGTEADYAALEKGIISMSKTLPASAVEIAGVAETAGQLGVAKENILSFSRTMIDLGEATDLTSDDAATNLAQFTNITGAVAKYGETAYSRLGSVIVDLGNKGASTESQIVAMGMRIAGAGAQVGLTDAQIMGVSSALASVGVEAEAGGSAMSTFLSNMNLAVSKGGKDLKKFAKVAGMSSKDFSKMFKDDAAGALEAFITGLGKAEDPIKTLSDMGIDDIRMRDALLRLAGGGTLLADSLDTANTAWSQNSALSAEASKRYATMESVLAMVKNNVTELARQLGNALASYVMTAAKWVGKLTEFLQGMSPELKDNIVKVGLFAAALGPGMIAISGILKGMSGFIGTFRIALGPVGLLAGGLAALYKLSPKFRNGLKSVTKSGKTFFRAIGQGLSPLTSFKFAMQQTFGKVGLQNAEAFLAKVDKGWSNTVTFLKHTGDGLVKAWAVGSKDGGFFGGIAASAKYLWPRLKLAFAAGWEAIKPAVVTLASNAMTALGNALQGTTFEGTGKELLDAAMKLKEGEKVDFSGLMDAFARDFTSWWDEDAAPWIDTFFKVHVPGGIGTLVGKALLAASKTMNTSGSMADSGVSLFTAADPASASALNTTSNSMSDPWYKAGYEWGKEAFTNYLRAAYKAATDQAYAGTDQQMYSDIQKSAQAGLAILIFKGLDKTEEAKKSGKSFVLAIAAGVFEGLANLYDKVKAWWNDLMLSFKLSINELFASLGLNKPFNILIAPEMGTTTNTTKDKLIGQIEKEFPGVTQTQPKSVWEQLEITPSSTGTVDMSEWGTGGWEAAQKGVAESAQAAQTAVDGTTKSIQDYTAAMEEVPPDIPIMQEVPKEVPKMQEVPQDIKKNLTPSMAGVGTDLANTLAASLSGGSTSLFTAADTAMTTALNGIDLTGTAKIGENFDKGIANGITAGTSWIKTAAANAATAAKLAAERALQVASPSKVGIKIGAFFTKGMAIGISSVQGAVSRASAGVASLAARGLTYSPVARTALAGAAGGSTRVAIDYNRLADVLASRPAVLNINGKELARTTAGDNAAASTRRTQRINAGYGV